MTEKEKIIASFYRKSRGRVSKRPAKSELFKMRQNHSVDYCANFYHVNPATIYRWTNYYLDELGASK